MNIGRFAFVISGIIAFLVNGECHTSLLCANLSDAVLKWYLGKSQMAGVIWTITG
jgi:hypothetical protein